MEYSPGVIKSISSDDNLQHYCPSEEGSSGSPILNLLNYKVIGIHKSSSNLASKNFGTLIKGLIKEFNELYKNNNEKKK